MARACRRGASRTPGRIRAHLPRLRVRRHLSCASRAGPQKAEASTYVQNCVSRRRVPETALSNSGDVCRKLDSESGNERRREEIAEADIAHDVERGGRDVGDRCKPDRAVEIVAIGDDGTAKAGAGEIATGECGAVQIR